MCWFSNSLCKYVDKRNQFEQQIAFYWHNCCAPHIIKKTDFHCHLLCGHTNRSIDLKNRPKEPIENVCRISESIHNELRDVVVVVCSFRLLFSYGMLRRWRGLRCSIWYVCVRVFTSKDLWIINIRGRKHTKQLSIFVGWIINKSEIDGNRLIRTQLFLSCVILFDTCNWGITII